MFSFCVVLAAAAADAAAAGDDDNDDCADGDKGADQGDAAASLGLEECRPPSPEYDNLAFTKLSCDAQGPH